MLSVGAIVKMYAQLLRFLKLGWRLFVLRLELPELSGKIIILSERCVDLDDNLSHALSKSVIRFIISYILVLHLSGIMKLY